MVLLVMLALVVPVAVLDLVVRQVLEILQLLHRVKEMAVVQQLQVRPVVVVGVAEQALLVLGLHQMAVATEV
jgi:hypothetical protein